MLPHPRRTHKIRNSAKTKGRIPVLSHLYVTRRHLVWYSWRSIFKRGSCACCKMDCLGLFLTNVDVEHLFQKVANLHDLPWPILHGFTANIWQNFTEVSARGKVNSVINTDNSLLCATVWHIRETVGTFIHTCLLYTSPSPRDA